MNYQKIHDSIIDLAKNRKKPDCYCERHHILPRSMGGDDSPENLVILTAREHFLIHWLLYKIHRNKEMTYAFHAMTKPVGNGRVRYTSHSFKYAREAMARWMSENMSGENHPCYGKFGEMSASFGSKRTDEQKQKISKKAKERYKKNPHPTAKRVVCIETNEVFKSIKEAKIKNGGNVSYAVRSGGTANGLHYEYIDFKYDKSESPVKLKGYAKADRHPRYKPIMNNRTKEVFDTAAKAGKSVGVTGAAVILSIKQNRSCRGEMFSYVNA